MELVNKTPFAAERVVLQDRSGRDLLVVVVKGTFAIDAKGRPLPSEEQLPVLMADQFYGKPGESSIRYEGDLAPKKTGTDVVLVGHAYPRKEKAVQVDVSLRVGAVRRAVRVFGDRRWDKIFGLSRMTSPERFEKIPLVYERAFGGSDLSAPDPKHHESEPRNPVGCGFRARKSKRGIEGAPLPNLEDPASIISAPDDRPAPAGFGFIGRHWQPRAAYAGTCDAGWMKGRFPLLPDDFDERYFNGADPRLVSKPLLRGDEPVELLGASPAGPLRFSLPGSRPVASVLVQDQLSALDLSFDTLILEPDASRFTMIWRGGADVYRRLYKVKKIEVAL